jgi:acetyl esterase
MAGNGPMTREESISLLHPELMAFLDRPSEDLALVPLPEAREKANTMARKMAGPVSRCPQVISIPGLFDAPNLEVRVHHPPDATPAKAVLHIHGGGMVKGSAAAFDARVCDIATKLGYVMASVEYRLAPETPYPGPLHDCVAAWLWLVGQVQEWGIMPEHCIITGDSSGGGLAAATSLYLRDTGAKMPSKQVLVFPMLDYLTGRGSEHSDQRLGWTSSNNQFGWRAYLGDQALPSGEALGHFSPAHAQEFAGLPPTWIGVGTIDLFLEENITFAARTAKAGPEVTLHTYKGAPHAFQSFQSSVSARFWRDYIAAFDF